MESPPRDALSLPLNELSAREVQSAVARRDVSCERVARACIERILAHEARVAAWVHFEPDGVLQEARRLDRADERGALHGVPVGVKDVIDTADMPTEMGSPIYSGYRPAADAACVALLRAAGALILGKTATCEFAGAAAARTTNPHDPLRTPGGSSSGSAAAVADYMVPLALGTQTGGSILRPASFCGIVGYKPTFGLISCAGVKPAAETLDTIGFMARTVEDVELAARVLTHSAESAWLPQDARLRIGLCRTYAWETAEDATKQALVGAATGLDSHGHHIEDVELPAGFGDLVGTREVINDYERARALAHEWRTKPESISGGLAQSIRRGLAMAADHYLSALRHVEACRRALQHLLEGLDVLLAPSVPGEAPVGLEYTGDHRFQSIWTQLRTPAVTLPTHSGPHGLPVGIQLVGRPQADRQLLAIARLVFAQLGRGPTVAR